MSVCLFSVSQQLYQLRNWSGGVPLTPDLEEGKLFLFTLTVVTETQLEAGLHHCTQLFRRLKPGQPQLPTIIQLVRMKMKNETSQKSQLTGVGRIVALVPRKRGGNKGLWERRIPLFGKLIPIGGLSQVDRFIPPAEKCWLVHSHGKQIYHVTSAEAPGRHSSDELNRVVIFLTLPDAQAHVHSQSAET